MTAAVKQLSERSAPALAISLLLHGAVLWLPMVGAFALTPPAPLLKDLPNSVVMLGNSIEIEAPTPELAATPAALAADEEPEPEAPPVDVRSLPKEAERSAEPEPKPLPATKPTPRKPRPERERPLPAAGSAAAAGSEAATTSSPAAGTFGQAGLAPGVRRLGYAFTRAIPAATPADSEWRELPAGKVGTIRVELEVDENNRLGALRQWRARAGEPAPPAILQRMVERTLILLRAGQFALSGSNQPGVERLVIDVQLRDEPAESAEGGEAFVVQKSFDGARPGHPGKAYFRYGMGRAVEATVTIVPAAPR